MSKINKISIIIQLFSLFFFSCKKGSEQLPITFELVQFKNTYTATDSIQIWAKISPSDTYKNFYAILESSIGVQEIPLQKSKSKQFYFIIPKNIASHKDEILINFFYNNKILRIEKIKITTYKTQIPISYYTCRSKNCQCKSGSRDSNSSTG